MAHLPTFKSLPPVEGLPHGCAWGLFDKPGQPRDQCGTLNLLTPHVVLQAKDEIQDGSSVALNWGMHNVAHPGFGRKPLQHKVFALPGFAANDDEIEINTQAGSQWDGFKHWAHQKTEKLYNGLNFKDSSNATDNGIHHWSTRGGIVGRGILLDYVRYCHRNNKPLDAWTRQEITVADLQAILNDENLTPRPGDIFIVRSGFTKRYNESSEQQQIDGIQKNHNFIGIQGCEEMCEWLWDHHFAAVAGDTIAMEAWPPRGDFAIHDFSLALWGQPIGELWDLERLAAECEKRGRWSFFLTSAPLNVVGGVGTPPNALAIF
ncbi:MAG: hypothetical protein Q9162_007118 [Coniocarpon cinnabarinum]